MKAKACLALFLLSLPLTAPAAPPQTLRFLISGHSLTDSPIDEFTARIAESLGTPATWERQNIPGSPISSRTIGHRHDPTRPDLYPWTGYSSGQGTQGKINLIQTLRQPGQPFTHLIVAERHDSLGPLRWENTVRLLRHFYELAREGSPQVSGFFYTTWLDIVGEGSTRDDPSGWVEFERAQLKLWECIPARINDSLARAGRTDRLTTLPASGALAELVHRAITTHLPGVSQESPAATMDLLFSDNVHLTPTGQYFIACVIYTTLTRQSPLGAWHPSSVSRETARTLQQTAEDYITAYFRGQPHGPQPDSETRLKTASSFAPLFWNYLGRPGQAEGDTRFFARRDAKNPLWFSPETDESGWWLPTLP